MPEQPPIEEDATDHDAYRRAFVALAKATDALQLALVGWHEARAAAESAWNALSEGWRQMHYGPRTLTPTRNPVIKGALREPEHLLGLSTTAKDAPENR